MKAKTIRVELQLAEAIQRTATALNIPTSQASIIVFFGLHKKSMWDKTLPEAKVDYIRRETKKNIAMGLTL